MAVSHKNHREYATDIAPRLNQHIEQLRDRAYEEFLGEAVMLFSFTLSCRPAFGSSRF